MKSMNPGIYDLSIEDYHASAGISRSGIMSFKKTPLHYWYEHFDPEYVADEPTPALIFGNALHTKLLEPEKFDDQYIAQPEKFDRRTAKGKADWAAFEEEAKGRIVLDPDSMAKIEDLTSKIMARPQESQLLTGGNNENSFYWEDPESGLLVKARPDIWHSNMVVDLKTTLDGSFRSCQSSIFKFGYHLQAAMILDGIFISTGNKIDNFIFLFVEKERPYASAIYVLDEFAIEAGRRDYKNQLMKMKVCLETNEWPSYPTSAISLPAYAATGE